MGHEQDRETVSLPVYTTLVIPTVTAYPSVNCLQWSGLSRWSAMFHLKKCGSHLGTYVFTIALASILYKMNPFRPQILVSTSIIPHLYNRRLIKTILPFDGSK